MLIHADLRPETGCLCFRRHSAGGSAGWERSITPLGITGPRAQITGVVKPVKFLIAFWNL